MAETKTIRVYQEDKEKLQEMAEAFGVPAKDVIAGIMAERAMACPECGGEFQGEEIDEETVEHHGVFTVGVESLVSGQRGVKSFDCPCCDTQISACDVEMEKCEYLAKGA